MSRVVRKAAVVILCAILLYSGLTFAAHRTYWGHLFLETYPAFDIFWRPIWHREQYDASIKFIEARMLTPATARFCPIGEAQFSSDSTSGKDAMAGWVDAQNPFSAMIRHHFLIVFSSTNHTEVDRVISDTGETWK